jgi:serine/threonine protein phosphatase PrpC
MKCTFCSLTDTGKVRPNNEDAVAVVAESGIVALADGMGGYNAGEVASALATETVVDCLGHWNDQATHRRSLPQTVEAAMQAANRAVYASSQAHPAHRGMATTLIVGVFRHKRLVVGHVGDSRAYRFRQGHLAQLTRDHSLLQEQIDAGRILPELAHLAQHRNVVTRAVGVADTVDIDLMEHTIEAGDTYLFCSDGLNSMLSDAEIAAILRRHAPLGQAAQALLNAANAAGGLDNISLILVQCAPPPTARPPDPRAPTPP